MKSLLFTALVCTCAPALANNAPTDPLLVRTVVAADQSLELRLANLERERVTVELLTLRGEDIVHRTRVKDHNGYCSRLKLEELDHGRYILRVTKGETVRQQVILKNEAGVACSDWK